MKKSIFIHVRLNTISCLIAVILFLTIAVAIPGYAQDLFGYKLDVGIESVKSVLENQGYAVHISRDLRDTPGASIEILDFKNEYLNNAYNNRLQLWIEDYKSRVYLYQWHGYFMPDSNTAGRIERLLHYISESFGEPKILSGSKSAYKNIDASLLQSIATDEESEGLHFLWQGKEKQIEVFVESPLLPMFDDVVLEFTLLYFTPKIMKEVSSDKD